MIHLSETLNFLVTPKNRSKFKSEKRLCDLKEGDELWNCYTDKMEPYHAPIEFENGRIKYGSRGIFLFDKNCEEKIASLEYNILSGSYDDSYLVFTDSKKIWYYAVSKKELIEISKSF